MEDSRTLIAAEPARRGVEARNSKAKGLAVGQKTPSRALMSKAEKLYQREVVGAFNSADALEGAISALASAGWDRAEMSLLAQEHVLAPNPIRASSDEIAENPESSRTQVLSDTDLRQTRTLATSIAGVVGAFIAAGAVMMTGGAVLTAIVGAAAAGGGAAAAVEAAGQFVGESRADFMEEQIRHGGILLWVLLHEPNEEVTAREIMTSHGAVATHVHNVERDES